MEIWKTIPHAPQYLCSNFGNVKSLRYQRNLKGSKNSCGYIRVQLGSSKNKHFVHRLVAECFLPQKDNCSFVNHKDGNKENNTAENLEWCTVSENTTHAINTGLRKPLKGEFHAQSKLCENDVIQINLLLRQGQNCTQIANLFNVNRKTISDIKNQKTWKHLINTLGFCQT